MLQLYPPSIKLFKSNTDIKPKKYTDIDDCLKLYTAAEVLDDVIWKCSNCNKQNEPSKQLHLWRLPEILIIHLKRFVKQYAFGEKIFIGMGAGSISNWMKNLKNIF